MVAREFPRFRGMDGGPSHLGEPDGTVGDKSLTVPNRSCHRAYVVSLA